MVYICENDNSSTMYKAKLHNPIENIVKIVTNVNCQRMNGVVYGFGNSLFYFYVIENKVSPNIDIEVLSSKTKVTDALATLELPVERKVDECYWRKKKTYQNNKKKQIGIKA